MRTLRSAATALLLAGCGTGNAWENYQETPVVERGACATILMPGEQAPLGSQPSCPNGYASIGGSIVYDEKDYKKTTSPGKAARAAASGPAAVLGAPVAAGAAVAKSVSRDGSQQGSSSSGGMTPEQAQVAAERERMDQMRREIMLREAQGRGQRPPPGAEPSAGATPEPTARAPRPGSASIANELAALRGARASAPDAPQNEPAISSEAAAPPAIAPDAVSPRRAPKLASAPVADRVADRDADGAPDHWMYRDEHGRPVREQFDENGDARPDRTAWLDAVTGAELRSEEDTNLDGRVDSWVEYANGAPTRQRRDSNADGVPDAWSYYDASGQLARQEQDLDGDGYRNRESLYRAGKLSKEREDRNGDGRFDLVTLYDGEERIARRDEDRDGDGRIDTRSIYEAGKLVRREIVSEPIDDGDDLSRTEWSSGGGH